MTTPAGQQAMLPWQTRLWMSLAAPLLRLIARALLASCRIERVEGEHHLDGLIESGSALLPCCWHQRLSVSVGYLLGAKTRGLRPGFLVSPSRDGELVARVVAGMGATVMRGSATRTGARALRDLYVSIREGTSPILHPDGPHGPARQVKNGGVMLAQMARTPLLPMAFSASRFWQLGSWDALIVPKPFARVVIFIGEPLTIARDENIEARASFLAEQLDALTARADGALGVAPARQRARR